MTQDVRKDLLIGHDGVDPYRKAILNDTYFHSFSEAVDHARKVVEFRGYTIDEDDWSRCITFGGKYSRSRPSVGDTHSFSIGLLKRGKPISQALQIIVYGMPSGAYELTQYIN
tara:strand:+ start:300 stop:638 length:339 start_codon:yes stop_codon:yes gene_type:complete